MQCGVKSFTFDIFSNLSLETPLSSVCNIKECLDLYFREEKINDWKCPECNEPREALKKIDITVLPPVLIIHLKRFYKNDDSFFQKNLVNVEFPLTNLKMSNYVSSEVINSLNFKYVYNLYAVSNHLGSMNSGHYTGKVACI